MNERWVASNASLALERRLLFLPSEYVASCDLLRLFSNASFRPIGSRLGSVPLGSQCHPQPPYSLPNPIRRLTVHAQCQPSDFPSNHSSAGRIQHSARLTSRFQGESRCSCCCCRPPRSVRLHAKGTGVKRDIQSVPVPGLLQRPHWGNCPRPPPPLPPLPSKPRPLLHAPNLLCPRCSS